MTEGFAMHEGCTGPVQHSSACLCEWVRAFDQRLHADFGSVRVSLCLCGVVVCGETCVDQCLCTCVFACLEIACCGFRAAQGCSIQVQACVNACALLIKGCTLTWAAFVSQFACAVRLFVGRLVWISVCASACLLVWGCACCGFRAAQGCSIKVRACANARTL